MARGGVHGNREQPALHKGGSPSARVIVAPWGLTPSLLDLLTVKENLEIQSCFLNILICKCWLRIILNTMRVTHLVLYSCWKRPGLGDESIVSSSGVKGGKGRV